MRLKLLILSLLIFSPVLSADITSPDNTFVANDQYSSDFHTRLNRNIVQLTDGVNNVRTQQVVNDTLLEADMADEINPRVRTYEGASCEFVYTGLLPVTDSDLTSDISAGTAYPRGYRISKSSATAKTYTASRWTYVDIDINGDFQYSVVTIGAATPSVATNAIRLARVSTDGTTISAVSDLRTTSCTNGPFTNIGSGTAGEPSLDDVLKNGAPVRRYSLAGRTPQGFAQGAFVSWDSHTAFKVTAGSLYINGEYRSTSSDITVPTTADDPVNGTSGLDTGSVTGGPVRYYVYGVADQDAVEPFSVSYSTSSSAPSGVTNYQLIGSITTDATNLFTSRDAVSTHGVNERELIGGWVTFNGNSTVAIKDGFNVSALADNNTGLYTISWDQDFNNAVYAPDVHHLTTSAGSGQSDNIEAITAGTLQVLTGDNSGSPVDSTFVSVSAKGDTRR